MDQYIGKMLDNRYEILERIGTGGMAVVYKARCHRLNRLVAIKILKPELASDEDFLRRFQVESQAVAMLSHINIVSIYDVCHSDGLNYIVMELIDGMTLKQYMQKRGTPLNWREALHFILQIVRALGHAHSRGIVHRDIKPHNIMVLRDGSVKVADFGIARLTSATQATLTQEALGSVHYISPEQAKGSHVDGRSDLYSIGVMLYEMLTGRLPFEGETPVFVAIQHINSIPIAPRDLNPDIPEALEAIVLKAMAPNPDQRYSSADDMLEDLKEFRKNPGAPAPQPGKPVAGEDEVEEPTMVMPVSTFGSAPEKVPAEKSVAEEKKPSEKKPAEQPRSAQEKKRATRREEADDDYYEKPRSRGLPPALIGIFAILIFIVGIGVFLYNFLLKDLLTPAEEYIVPDLRGYTIEQLTNTPSLTGGFKIEVGPTVDDAVYKAGQICRQQPAQNTPVKDPDTVITVTISSGEVVIRMPDISTKEGRVAVQELSDLGLIVTPEHVYSDEYPAGTVISCSLYEGTIVKKGDSVTVVISRGPEEIPVNVLPFLNIDFEQAKSQAEGLGLTVGEPQYFFSDTYAEGHVMWQNIAPETQVEKGTTIIFHVSKGPESATEPDPVPSPGEGIDDPPAVQTTRKTVVFDLTPYEGVVHVLITVGNQTLHDGTVDTSVGTLSRDVTGSGVQFVTIYVNGELVKGYELDFSV